METSPSPGNDWAPSQSLLFCDRTMQAVLPTPSSQRHSLSYTHTHIFFPSSSFLHLYGAVTKMGLGRQSSPIASGWNAFWHGNINEDGLTAEQSVCHPRPGPAGHGDWREDLLVRLFSCFFFFFVVFSPIALPFAIQPGPTFIASALHRMKKWIIVSFFLLWTSVPLIKPHLTADR